VRLRAHARIRVERSRRLSVAEAGAAPKTGNPVAAIAFEVRSVADLP